MRTHDYSNHLDRNGNAVESNIAWVNMPADEYFSSPAISKHTLDDFERNPWGFFRRLAEDKKAEELDTPALAFGKALHTAFLQPQLADAETAVIPAEIKVKRGKVWEEFASENAGKTIISQDQNDALQGALSTLAKFKPATEILAASPDIFREISIFWKHAKFPEIQLKSRLDFAAANGRVIGDLKTCADASPAGFAKACDAYGYARQAAFYLDATLAATGVAPEVFAFICIEKEYPFTPALYTFDADSDFINAGRVGYLVALKKFNDFSAQKFDEMPVGFSEHNLDLPPWNADYKRYREALMANGAPISE